MKFSLIFMCYFLLITQSWAQVSPDTIEGLSKIIETEVETRATRQMNDFERFRLALINSYHGSVFNSLPDDTEVFRAQFPTDIQEKAERFTTVKKIGEQNSTLECMAVTYPKGSSSGSIVNNTYDCSSPMVRINGYGELVLLDYAAEAILSDFKTMAQNKDIAALFLVRIFGHYAAQVIDQFLNYEIEVRSENSSNLESSKAIISLIFTGKRGLKSPFNSDSGVYFNARLALGECGDTKSMSSVTIRSAEAFAYNSSEPGFIKMCKMTLSAFDYRMDLRQFFDTLAQHRYKRE